MLCCRRLLAKSAVAGPNDLQATCDLHREEGRFYHARPCWKCAASGLGGICHGFGWPRAQLRVPKMRSPASPRPGTI
jgi:hypothetical protein